MKKLGKVSIAVACALGAGAVMAQSVVRDGKVVSTPTTQTVAQAPATASTQVAQAGAAAGGAAGGASTGGAIGTVGVAGSVASTTIFIGTAVAAAAVQANNSEPTVKH